MACRQATEIDLAAFLLEPGGPEWTAFRTHYPQCQACAAEVRAWTELQSMLGSEIQANGGAHPTEEQLLRYEDTLDAAGAARIDEKPTRLSAAERNTIAQHLSQCRSCADELGALRRFDLSLVRPEVQAEMPGGFLRTVLSRMRQVVLHPAFAYALLLVALYPTIRHGAFTPQLESPRPPGELHQLSSRRSIAAVPAAEEGAPVVAESAERDLPELEAMQDRVHLHVAPQVPAATRETPSPERARADTQVQRTERARAASLRSRAQEATMYAEGVASEERAKRPARTARVLTAAEGEAAERKVAAAARASGAGGSRVWTIISLDPSTPAEVDSAQLADDLLLRLPLGQALPDSAEIEVRVRSTDGRRELRESARLHAGAEHVEMRLPSAWLAPDAYRIEVRAGTTAAAEARSFSLRVR